MAEGGGGATRSLRRTLGRSAARPALPLLTLDALRDMPRGATIAAIRALCAAVPMGDGMTLCRTLGRHKLFVDNDDFGLSPNLLLDGYWEMWVTLAMLDAVRPGMRAVDVGANLGYFTLLLADLVGSSGHVHGFEPNPRSMRLLARSVALNGYASRTTLHAAPLGARTGEKVRLVVPIGNPKNAYLSRLPPGAAEAASASHDLNAVALDDVIGEERVDFIKIDAEGAERDIWHGMRRLVARAAKLTIFMEFAADRYPAPDAFLAEFAAAGLSLARIDHRAGVVAVSERDVLNAPREVDQMLVLTR